MWLAVKKALKARSPQGHGGALSRRRQRNGGGGAGTNPLWTWWPLAAATYDIEVGMDNAAKAWLLRAAEMRRNTSGSDAGGLTAGGGGCSMGQGEGGWGGEALRRKMCP